MEPTYKHNDLLMVKSWNARSFIQRQKKLLIDLPHQYGGKSIKRLIGLPGDTVKIEDGSIYINGSTHEEAYLDDMPKTKGTEMMKCVVPLGHVFVLGDYRNYVHGVDSRMFGPLPLSNIKGTPKSHASDNFGSKFIFPNKGKFNLLLSLSPALPLNISLLSDIKNLQIY